MQLADAVRRYLNASLAEGKSVLTIRNARTAFKELIAHLANLGIERIEDLTHDALMAHREELAWRMTAKGTPLTARSQIERLGHLRAFCRYLVREDWLLADPSARLPNPKKPRALPRAILEEKEVSRILQQPDLRTARGYRDRVILEVLYSAALRREEVANLKTQNVDTATGYAHVREGKGGKDRVVPIGRNVCALIETYLAGVRGDWPNAQATDYLFLNRWGKRMDPNAVWAVVRKYAKQAGIKKPVSTHTFRHSCATHMLRAGAPIRHLQEMLGHAQLTTTQVYTRLTINDLKAVHGKYHPREQAEADADAVAADAPRAARR
jgi:integrase/recombinase XerD